MTISSAGWLLDPDSALPSFGRDLAASAATAAGSVRGGLDVARRAGTEFPLPGSGRTAQRFALLALLAEQDLTVARIVEAHTDALAILAEAGRPVPAGVWGVFAAEAPGQRLTAADAAGRSRLSGHKPWCSIAGELDGALVTAHPGSGRRLYAVDLRQPGVRVHPPDGWVARGMPELVSGPVDFADVPAEPVGGPGWYLERDGFSWGGIGVAACWFGGAVGLYGTLLAAAAQRTDELTRLHVGAVDALLAGAAAVLRRSAEAIDRGAARGAAGELLALRVRAVVADAAEKVIGQLGHALGPGPLAFDLPHARRVADLTLYLRQHHAERDLARLGATVLETTSP